MPVLYLMTWSVDDKLINKVLPRTFDIYEQWDGDGLPSEPHYEAMFKDIADATGLQIDVAALA